MTTRKDPAPYQRAGRWWLDLRRFGGRQESLGTTDETTASVRATERVLAAKKGNVQGAPPVAAPRAPFGTLVDTWLAEREATRDGTEGHIDSVRLWLVKHWGKLLGPQRDLTTITSPDLRAAMVRLKLAGLSPWSQKHARSAMTSFLNWAVEAGHLQAVPVFPKGKKKRGRIKARRPPIALTGEQACDALDAARTVGDEEHAIVSFWLHTACRPGEAFAVRGSDLDLDGPAPSVRFTPSQWSRSKDDDGAPIMKTERSDRTTPLPPDLVRVLKAHLNRRKLAGETWELVFPSPMSGRRGERRRHSPRSIWKRVAAEAFRATHDPLWAPGRTQAYDLRHTGISHALQLTDRGAPISPSVVAERVGNSTTILDAVYRHLPKEVEASAGRGQWLTYRRSGEDRTGPVAQQQKSRVSGKRDKRTRQPIAVGQ